jgi:hypothetical protein
MMSGVTKISLFLILGDGIGQDIFGASPVSTKRHGRFKKSP